MKSTGPLECGVSVTGSDVILSPPWFQVQAAAGGLTAAELRLATAVLQLPAGRDDPPPVQ